MILLLTTVLLFRAQMLTPLLTSLMAMALFFIFSRKFAVFVGVGLDCRRSRHGLILFSECFICGSLLHLR